MTKTYCFHPHSVSGTLLVYENQHAEADISLKVDRSFDHSSQLVTLGARKMGGQGAADVVLKSGKEIAVKFSVRNDWAYDYTVSPEKDGVVVIIIPRRLQFYVIPIAGNVVNEHLQLDNAKTRQNGVLVGIDELEGTVKVMLSK